MNVVTRWWLVGLVVAVAASALPFRDADHALLAQGFPAEEAVRRMTVPKGFAVDLVAAEPLVRQPVAIDFDDRGRLWVLQYLQYPNPAGLQRVSVDRYSRTTYDRVPLPPPHGPQGADRLTILTDTDGDGRADQAKDFVSNLNLATGFAFGYGGVFVLQTPYLLFYPDRDADDVPDGEPTVLLSGFGMEDTSSLANSLLWGPDGWLYGTQGTNLTANIRGIQFEQGVWRYHPQTKQFELFFEGGSNMWGLDFDRHGNLLAGTNYGGYLMFHGVQGGYYQKSFAKHGQLHNPFAFGYFEHVPHKNFQGGHVTVGGFLYQADAFPSRFRDTYIAVDTLGHAVRWHHVRPDKSTLRSENGGVLLQANDTWFAPSDATVGPDGAVYIADWYDQRTAHPDPDATWDRSNGRIYRLRGAAAPPVQVEDPHSLTDEQLTAWLLDRNAWKSRRALRILAERGGAQAAENLAQVLNNAQDPQHILQLIWALHSLGQLDIRRSEKLLDHGDPTVRAWIVRLFTDDLERLSVARGGESAAEHRRMVRRLVDLAASETSPVVLRQLASTAKRLSGAECLPIVGPLSRRGDIQSDPLIPLLTWWAVERHAVSSLDRTLATFSNSAAWQSPSVRDVILGRLMRRYAADGSRRGLEACASLLQTAPNADQRRRMIAELDTGLQMLGRKKLPRLPLPESALAIQALADLQETPSRVPAVPPSLAAVLQAAWDDAPRDLLLIRVAARLGKQEALDRAVSLAADGKAAEADRLAALAILRDLSDEATAVGPAMRLLAGMEPLDIRMAALELLGRFSDQRITDLVLAEYPRMAGDLQNRARAVLLGRADSALAFLQEVDLGTFPATDISTNELRQVALHDDRRIEALVQKHWGNIRAGTPEEKLAEIRRIKNDLRAGSGNINAGRAVFQKKCAGCHKLFGRGEEIGPDLTKANRQDRDFLLVSMVDPNAQIRKEFLSYIVATEDGRVVTGLLAGERAASINLLDAKNRRTTISRDDIQEIRVSPLSLMPEDVLGGMTPQQLRDLMRFLQSNGQ